jgi:hypothetical protein
VSTWPRLAALVPALLLVAAAQAAESFQVQSAFANVRGDVVELDARISFPVNDEVRSTLDNGATVKLALQVVVERERRYWLDKELVEATLRRELSWNAVSRRYILRHVDSGEQDTFAALDEALAAAGVVRGWQLPLGRKLNPDKAFTVSVRAGYRSTRLPAALRALAFWSDGWSRKTEWMSWILPR